MNDSEEQELLARAQASADGFGELFDAYYERIYAYAYRRVGTRAAAEDIAACTFEDALRGIKRLRWHGKPVVAWLYRIASRRVADHYRRAADHPAADWELIQVADGRAQAPLEDIERQEIVRAALEKLSPRDREVIKLIYFDELNAAEVAALSDSSTNSVYVRLHRALGRLQALLKTEVPENGME